MRSLTRLAAIVAAATLTCAPIAAQTLTKDSALPLAQTLTGAEGFRTTQGSGCATSVSPCANVRATPAQIATYLAPTFQATDADLAAIAALSASATTRATTSFGLSLLIQPDAPTARGTLGLGSNATDSTPRVPTSLTISTAAPLAGGGALTGNLALSIGAASGTAAGTMSAADKAKLDGIAAGATANTGTVTSVSATGANGIGVTVTNAGTTPAIAITGSALTPSTLAATGAVTGSNLSGTNTGDQTITLTGDVTGSGTGSFAATLASSGVTAGTYGASGTLSVPIVTFDAKGRGTAASAYALGSAAGATIGTSGGTVGLLNGSNTYSGAMTFSQLITGSVSGNAGTTTKLATARKLNGVAFDGTADITLPAVDTATPRLVAANNLSDLGSSSAALANLGIGAGKAAGQTYVEGTFTPSLTLGGNTTGITYNTRSGRYTQVGRMIFVQVSMILTSKGSATGNATIAGLPFAAGVISAGTLILSSVSSVQNPSVSLPASATALNVITFTGSSLAFVTDTNLTNTSEFYLAIAYSI